MMHTECNVQEMLFQPLHGRQVKASFEGGMISGESGALLLREVEHQTGLIRRFAECFEDFREPGSIDHSVYELVAQRIFGLALGYEDLNDHDELRLDWLLATAVGKKDVTGKDRRRSRDKDKPLAGKSTLNRLELTLDTPSANERYKKIASSPTEIDDCLIDDFIASQTEEPSLLILDPDATDDPVHGMQEGRFFHGYYREYCFLPLYIFCGDAPLCARLRPANIDASKGTVEELERIVGRLRERWPNVRILVRADSGFARDEIMLWCENNHVDYVFGLAKNSRLNDLISSEMEQARVESEAERRAARQFTEFGYRTLDSWSRMRRVIAKAEYLIDKANPRFIVTSLSAADHEAQSLYEDTYCARGDMENRIKEQQLDLFADRTSTHYLKSNQLRLYFSTIAYMLMNALRRLGLKGTELEKAQCGTIRLKLLKIGALIRTSVRRITVSLSGGYPYKTLFNRVLQNLTAASP